MAISIEDYGEDCLDLFDVYFYDDCIKTLVTHESKKVVKWISKIEYIHRRRLNRLIVGLDVEWRPNHHRGEQNPVAILQICVGRHCLIFQLLHCNHIPAKLFRFLANPSYTFAGVGIPEDIGKLRDDYGLEVTNAVELRFVHASVTGNWSLKNDGLKDLALIYMGAAVEKPKSVTMSHWDQDWLTYEQIQYACVDAFVSFEIGRILNANEY